MKKVLAVLAIFALMMVVFGAPVLGAVNQGANDQQDWRAAKAIQSPTPLTSDDQDAAKDEEAVSDDARQADEDEDEEQSDDEEAPPEDEESSAEDEEQKEQSE